jgi:hypothetical protein
METLPKRKFLEMSKLRLMKVLLEELCWVPLSSPSLYYCFLLSLSLFCLSHTLRVQT